MASFRESSLLADLPILRTEPPRDLSCLRDVATTRRYERIVSGGLVAAFVAVTLTGYLSVWGGQLAALAVVSSLGILASLVFVLYGWANHRNLLELVRTGTACRGTVANLSWYRGRYSGADRTFRDRDHHGNLFKTVHLSMGMTYVDATGAERHLTTEVDSHRNLTIGADIVVLIHPSKEDIAGAVARGGLQGAYEVFLASHRPRLGRHPKALPAGCAPCWRGFASSTRRSADGA